MAEHFFLFWCSIMCLVESSCYTHVSHHSSFSYLHSCEPPIIHGNLTCDTIFIQHNGLIKIGSGGLKHSDFLNVIDFIIFADFFFVCFFVVAPDTINNHVKTCREEQKSLHFFAPEYGGKTRF